MRFRAFMWMVVAGLALLAGPGLELARAGGGPENVLLLVNASNESSRAVANHYVALRAIPASNVVSLDDVPTDGTMSIADFRAKIVEPAIKAMASRGLGGQIDYIVYSAGFPTAIDLTGDGRPPGLPASGKVDGYAPTGSLNGMTFLWQMAMAKDPRYIHYETNRYYRHPSFWQPNAPPALPTQAFSAWRGWDKTGKAADEGGMHYYLSTMLGATGRRANTLAEIVAYLEAAAKADGTKPSGTIYYVKSSDAARSGPRHGHFENAIKDLSRYNVRGELLEGQMPMGKADVQGVMMGVGKFDWKSSGSRIQPGAICDHLTSFGGTLAKPTSQTMLTEYLKYGAAGACGTVVEPLNYPNKFPHPNIHVHYAAGCSLAEAFYQSIGWVYQVAIVGDPLCRPWANIPKVTIEGVKANEKTKGTITITPTATVAGGRGIARFDLFVDGVRRDKVLPGKSFALDTTALTDGYHELRVVAIEGGPIESQGRAILPLLVDNNGKTLTLSSTAKQARSRERIEIKVDCAGAKRIVVSHLGREIGKVDGSAGRVRVNTRELGSGPATFQATAFAADADGGMREVPLAVAAPLVIEILP
jgi:hypothetical protein